MHKVKSQQNHTNDNNYRHWHNLNYLTWEYDKWDKPPSFWIPWINRSILLNTRRDPWSQIMKTILWTIPPLLRKKKYQLSSTESKLYEMCNRKRRVLHTTGGRNVNFGRSQVDTDHRCIIFSYRLPILLIK